MPVPIKLKQLPDTGYSHPRCYASALGGCSTKISGEHAISEGFLRVFSTGNTVAAKGFAWMTDPESHHDHSLSAFKSNVLCKHHNEVLSPLDNLGRRWSSRLLEQHKRLSEDRVSKEQVHLLTNGNDLERWLLKVLCGLVVSGMAECPNIAEPKSWRPPKHWLKSIYEGRPLPQGCGLYSIVRAGEELTGPWWGFGVRTNRAGGVIGLDVYFFSVRFVLAMTGVRAALNLEEAWHRPAIFQFTNGPGSYWWLSSWAGPSDGGHVPVIVGPA